MGCFSFLRPFFIGLFFSGFLLMLPAVVHPEQPKSIDANKAARWMELLERSPFPYHKPLPEKVRTPVDGIFVKFDPKPHPHVPCRRCPDWVPEGGIWKLQLDKGILRIFFAETGWRSISSFEVSGDRLQLFNDPHCSSTVGTYYWEMHEGQLTFKLIEDRCAILMRGKNLTKQPWKSCQPPNHEAATTGHWPVPPGCD